MARPRGTVHRKNVGGVNGDDQTGLFQSFGGMNLKNTTTTRGL